MAEPLPPAARVILSRMARSMSPWRVAALMAADRQAMDHLEAQGLVDRHQGVYRLTAAGRVVRADSASST